MPRRFQDFQNSFWNISFSLLLAAKILGEVNQRYSRKVQNAGVSARGVTVSQTIEDFLNRRLEPGSTCVKGADIYAFLWCHENLRHLTVENLHRAFFEGVQDIPLRVVRSSRLFDRELGDGEQDERGLHFGKSSKKTSERSSQVSNPCFDRNLNQRRVTLLADNAFSDLSSLPI
eukprot:gb/GECG01005657.1/.p1 GENE.gb/GECG01005657.1/~~gb/GECG01005657.1/.p1  ORF type:complete len:174 (+),score=9.90 gb/GECG01005657.1/:1-522(+)